MDEKLKAKIIEEQKLAYKIKTNKIKKTIIGSIIKEIRNFFKKNYWNIKFNVNYKIKSLQNYKNIFENKISILVPSRGRSKKLGRFLETLTLNTAKLKRIELLILLDNDEIEIENYLKLVDNYNKNINIKIFQINLKTHAERNNYLAKKSNGSVIFPANDDLVIETINWDNLVDKEFSKVGINEPLCLWVDSGNKYPYLHCHFPIINKEWYKRLGYVGSELFNFWYLDTWICDLAKKSNKMLYAKRIKFKEFNAQSNLSEFDETYMKNISDNKMEKDLDIWNNSMKIRIEESKKLLN